MRGWKRKKPNPSNYSACKCCRVQDGPVATIWGQPLFRLEVEVIVSVDWVETELWLLCEAEVSRTVERQL